MSRWPCPSARAVSLRIIINDNENTHSTICQPVGVHQTSVRTEVMVQVKWLIMVMVMMNFDLTTDVKQFVGLHLVERLDFAE